MKRRRFSETALMRRLLEFDGRCACGCHQKVGGAAGLEWDHVIPLANGGADEIENLQPLTRSCHKKKTAEDAGNIAKAKRMQRREAGIKKQSRWPLRGGRNDTIKRKLDGTVVPRGKK